MSEPKWDISRLSAGERSALRRNAGIMMDSADLNAIEAFYHALLKGCSKYQEKAWFAALCMQCLWREQDQPQIYPFPELLKQVYQSPTSTDSIRKRCTNFMDLFWADDGFLLGKICSLVRKMRSDHSNYMPDFESLADDLSHWNNENHYIQRKWLEIICRNNTQDDEKMEAE